MRNWLLVLLNLAFIGAGLVMIRDEPHMAIVTIAFFGSCLAITLVMMFQWRLNDLVRVRKISVVGGVRIKPRRTFLYVTGAWMIALGLILYWFGDGYPLLFRLIGLLIAVVGAVFGGAALLGRLPRGHLRFDPDAFELGHGAYAVRIPWDAISRVADAEYHMNPVLLITLHDERMLTVVPSDKTAAALKLIASNRAWTGADYMLMPSQYGLTLSALGSAILRYVNDPAARAELVPALPPPGLTSQA